MVSVPSKNGGRGIGKHLVAGALRHAVALGALSIEINVVPTKNPRIVPWYERQGFECVGEEEPAYWTFVMKEECIGQVMMQRMTIRLDNEPWRHNIRQEVAQRHQQASCGCVFTPMERRSIPAAAPGWHCDCGILLMHIQCPVLGVADKCLCYEGDIEVCNGAPTSNVDENEKNDAGVRSYEQLELLLAQQADERSEPHPVTVLLCSKRWCPFSRAADVLLNDLEEEEDESRNTVLLHVDLLAEWGQAIADTLQLTDKIPVPFLVFFRGGQRLTLLTSSPCSAFRCMEGAVVGIFAAENCALLCDRVASSKRTRIGV
jgi:hypothetical protein